MLACTNICPLGSGAIAGNPFPIDRQALALDLGFDSASRNSMQAVADRDFVAQFLFWSALTAVHFSRLAEDLVIYSSKEFSFVTIAEQFRCRFYPEPASLPLPVRKQGTALKCLSSRVI